jgi:hypothetical protein
MRQLHDEVLVAAVKFAVEVLVAAVEFAVEVLVAAVEFAVGVPVVAVKFAVNGNGGVKCSGEGHLISMSFAL